MVYEPKIGDIITMFGQHAVVLNVFHSSDGKIVLLVQKANNVFRGKNPELIEMTLAAHAIAPSTMDGLQREIEALRQSQHNQIAKLLNAAMPQAEGAGVFA